MMMRCLSPMKSSLCVCVLLLSACVSWGFGVYPAKYRKRGLSRTYLSESEVSSADTSAAETSEAPCIVVALTREKGKNSKLTSLLSSHPTLELTDTRLSVKELPCIEHATGPDLHCLVQILKSGKLDKFDYVVITSPEAAKVLGEALQTAGIDAESIHGVVKVAAVGKATQKALTKQGFSVDFVPSKANGETLAKEMPCQDEDHEPTKVLYPASSKAADTIQNDLEARTDHTFSVTRLNTYDTVPATFTPQQHSIMDQVHVAAFGSPSSVHAWLANIDAKNGYSNLSEEDKSKLGPQGNGNVAAACIGTTTAKAVLESGRWHANDIYYPKENPGMDGWANSVLQAVGDVAERKFWAS